MKSNKRAILVFCVFLVLAGCGGGGGGGNNNNPPPATDITVTPGASIFVQGVSQQFVATKALPAGTTEDITTSVTWSSSNPAVATVTSTGVVTAVGQGTATIQAVDPTRNVVSSTTLYVQPITAGSGNQLTVTVNGSLCSAATSANYLNKPCVSVTICTPGTANCQTINDILLDTGSYGLRIFKQALTVPLTPAPGAAGTLGECAFFADSKTWGPVQLARVAIAGEPPMEIPIQVIDATFGNRTVVSNGVQTTICSGAEASPASAQFTGILGVGLFAQDCGPGCATDPNVGMYFSCSGSATCTPTTVPLANQVQNPATALSQDNNGVVVKLPAIPATGAASVDGTLVLGVGTQADNTPAPGSVTRFRIREILGIPTIKSDVTGGNAPVSNVDSFLDTGSNGIFIPSVTQATATTQPFLPISGPWFVPPNNQILLTATTTENPAVLTGGSDTAASKTFDFLVVSPTINPSARVLYLAGPTSIGAPLDWGLPFFLGRDVYHGFEGASTTLGTGPFWAY